MRHLRAWMGGAVVACAAGIVGASGGGCASGPSVGGFGIFSKYVKVGDIVELSAPFDPQTGLEWRIASYDSARLEIRTRPRIVPRGDGYEMVAGFQAKLPGSTEVVFERRPGAGEPGDKVLRRFKVNILQ